MKDEEPKRWTDKQFEKAYRDGMKKERERILNLIKLRIGRLILETENWKKPEKYQFYARINELKELKQKIKEQKK
jgi:hypothetical protein